MNEKKDKLKRKKKFEKKNVTMNSMRFFPFVSMDFKRCFDDDFVRTYYVFEL